MKARRALLTAYIGLAFAGCLGACGGDEKAEGSEAAAPETTGPASPATPPPTVAPADDEGFPSEWRSIRAATLAAFEPCMAELAAGAPGSACVRYSELVVIFRQAEALRLWQCEQTDAPTQECREPPADPVRQAEYDRVVNPGGASVEPEAAVTPDDAVEAPSNDTSAEDIADQAEP